MNERLVFEACLGLMLFGGILAEYAKYRINRTHKKTLAHRLIESGVMT